MRLISQNAGTNRHQSIFRAAVGAEQIGVRHLGLQSYMLTGDEWQRRLALETCYQLSAHVEGLSDPRLFFATMAFADLPGSRLRKSDSMRAMLEYKLQRDSTGGTKCAASDIPSLLVQNKSTGGQDLTRAQSRPTTVATHRSTERVKIADSWSKLLHHLDCIPPTVTASPIQALAGFFVEAIQKQDNSTADSSRCKSMMTNCGWDWDRNVPAAGVEAAQLKAGVLRAARLALDEFPDQDEEDLMLRHSKMSAAAGCNVRPQYGAYADAAVVNMQENVMQCEALLHTLVDIQNLITKLEDEHTTLRGIGREHAEVSRRIAQLIDQINADAQAASDFENLEIKNQALAPHMPFSAHQNTAWVTTSVHRQQASTAVQEVVARTHLTLERESDELERLQARQAAIGAARADHVADARFCERQLDICVTSLKDCGLQHIRGSTTLDLRGALQKDAVERNVTLAVDQIVESVSQLQLVNRGFHKGAKLIARPSIGQGRACA